MHGDLLPSRKPLLLGPLAGRCAFLGISRTFWLADGVENPTRHPSSAQRINDCLRLPRTVVAVIIFGVEVVTQKVDLYRPAIQVVEGGLAGT